ncbi:MAG TPA: Lrp/AsnC ligand binding domain-containing protein [Actinomycetota bacterium]
MVEAFVLVQVDVAVGRHVGEEMVRVPGVQLAQVVTGPYDVIARVEADTMEALGAIIDGIQAIAGVTRTLTCPVIRV